MAHGSILGQKLEDALLVDGSKSMQANLNMNNHKVTNVTNGTANTDAATVGQVNAAVASKVVAIFGNNDEESGVVIGPTCLYVWKDGSFGAVTITFDSQYATINKWYNLSGLYNRGITQLDLLGPSGTNTSTIGRVYISDSSFGVFINTTYCGFAYFQTFDYN